MNLPWIILLAAVPSFLIAWATAPLIRRRAERWRLVARPRTDRFHSVVTPTGGGLAIWLGVTATFAVGQVAVALLAAGVVPADWIPEIVETHLGGFVTQSWRLWQLLAAAAVMMCVGLLDDRGELDWRLRLAVQTFVALAVVRQGWELTLFVDQPLITQFLSVVWIVGIVNSFNMLDNMDGLAAGIAWIVSVLLAAVMLSAPDPESSHPQLFVAGFMIVLSGAIAGFWWHNRPPATIFMGDAGSYFIGFCIAMGTLMATFAGGDIPRHAVFAPLCVLAVPIYDTLSVIVIRLREGRSPFEGDKNHFSHRLVKLGLTTQRAVWTVYLLTTACGMGALLLHQVDAAGAAVVLAMITCMLLTVAILEAAGRK